MDKNETTILTVKEAAERWKISYSSLVRMIHANEIPFIQIGKRSYRLREEDFIQAMTAARPKGPVEKLADMIRDFPAEDIWEMERYAEFLAARRELPKKNRIHFDRYRQLLGAVKTPYFSMVSVILLTADNY